MVEAFRPHRQSADNWARPAVTALKEFNLLVPF
jgi:hypothetical protein